MESINWKSIEDLQKTICSRFESRHNPPMSTQIIAIGLDIELDKFPLNGLRLREPGDHSGWYVWSGENLSQDTDYFRSVHIFHLIEIRTEILPFLGLDYGWRFLVAPGHLDVWFDPELK